MIYNEQYIHWIQKDLSCLYDRSSWYWHCSSNNIAHIINISNSFNHSVTRQVTSKDRKILLKKKGSAKALRKDGEVSFFVIFQFLRSVLFDIWALKWSDILEVNTQTIFHMCCKNIFKTSYAPFFTMNISRRITVQCR